MPGVTGELSARRARQRYGRRALIPQKAATAPFGACTADCNASC